MRGNVEKCLGRVLGRGDVEKGVGKCVGVCGEVKGDVGRGVGVWESVGEVLRVWKNEDKCVGM